MIPRALTCAVLTALLAFHVGVSPLALEKTAGNENDSLKPLEVATGLQLTTIRTIVETAINALSGLASLVSRVAALENTMSHLYGTWRPWVEGVLSSYNSRISALESTPAGTISIGNCYDVISNPSSGSGGTACNSGYVMTKAYLNGTLPGCSSAGCARIRQSCCQLTIH
jgi:hypothetical protein